MEKNESYFQYIEHTFCYWCNMLPMEIQKIGVNWKKRMAKMKLKCDIAQ